LVIENISLDRAQSLVDTSPEGIQYFFKVIRAGFAHKRKFAKRNLEIVMSPDTIDEAWKIVGLNDKERAENISIDQWIRVATHGLSKG
jgi:16S rRNA A1518/A1519 N6-dimethyltransferase RsmA/KsgA/DIM1 with predicted DNA glycosylase/AP lyase activity